MYKGTTRAEIVFIPAPNSHYRDKWNVNIVYLRTRNTNPKPLIQEKKWTEYDFDKYEDAVEFCIQFNLPTEYNNEPVTRGAK